MIARGLSLAFFMPAKVSSMERIAPVTTLLKIRNELLYPAPPVICLIFAEIAGIMSALQCIRIREHILTCLQACHGS